jgi:hypothetical protein
MKLVVSFGVIRRPSREIGRVPGHVSEQHVREQFAAVVAHVLFADGGELRMPGDEPVDERDGFSRGISQAARLLQRLKRHLQILGHRGALFL